MKINKKYFLSLIPIAIYILLGIIFDGDHLYMVFSMLLLMFSITYVLFKKKILIKKKDIITIVWLIVSILTVASIFKNNFSRTLVYIVFIPFFSLFGYLFWKNKSILYLISIIIFSLIINFYIQPNFLIYYYSFDRKELLTNKEFPNIEFVDSNSKSYVLPKDKIIVLDFWNTSCSVCFNKFPKFNKLYNKYKDDKRVLILAVNVPINNEKFIERKDAFENEKLDFKTLYTNSLIETQNALNFNTYPNILILKNNKILFQGNIEPISDFFSYYYVSVDKKLGEILSE